MGENIKEIICVKCKGKVYCNGLLGKNERKCLIPFDVIQERKLDPRNPFRYLPFKEIGSGKIYCVCIECWQKHLEEREENSPSFNSMFRIGCWEGLEEDFEFFNPSRRFHLGTKSRQ